MASRIFSVEGVHGNRAFVVADHIDTIRDALDTAKAQRQAVVFTGPTEGSHVLLMPEHVFSITEASAPAGVPA